MEKVIVFELGKEEYAIPVSQVQSIEKLEHITRVPKTKPYIIGVMNLRGIILPIIDLRIRFGASEVEYTEHARIIILSMDDIQVGMVVDAANDVLDIREEEMTLAPKVVGTVEVDYISGIAKLGSRLLNLLYLEKVLEIVKKK